MAGAVFCKALRCFLIVPVSPRATGPVRQWGMPIVLMLLSIKGKVKATIPQGRGTIDINLKLADVAKRDVVATAQVARTRTFKGGQLTSTQPAKVIGGKLVSGLTDITPTKFVFGKEAPVLRDISLAEIGQGQISIIDVKVPRVVESTIITRTGTVTGFLTLQTTSDAQASCTAS